MTIPYNHEEHDQEAAKRGRRRLRRYCAAHCTDGKPCLNPPALGTHLCRKHGAKSLRGRDLPQFKHGKYSKDVPTRLLARYQEAEADPDLYAMRHELALLDARLHDVLGNVDRGESGVRWKEVGDQVLALMDSIRTKNADAMMAAANALDKLAASGTREYLVWGEIYELVEQRRKLAESEQKRLIAAHQVITAEQAMVFAAAMTQAVRERVADEEVRNSILGEFMKLTNKPEPLKLEDSNAT